MHENSVVLPAPLGPIMPSRSPFSTENETLSRTSVPPYENETLSSSTTRIATPPSGAPHSPSSCQGSRCLQPAQPWLSLQQGSARAPCRLQARLLSRLQACC